MLSLIKRSILPHLVFCYVFLFSGLIINFAALLTLLFVWPFNHRLYRRLNYYLAFSLWGNVTAWAQYWSSTRITLYCNEEDYKHLGKENFIGVCSHKYSIDWLMGWVVCQQINILGGCKVVIKNTLKYIPVLGWSFTFSEQIYVKREWEKDNKSLVKDLGAVFDYPEDLNYCVVIFPEGTRFNKEKHEASMEIAKQKGLPVLKHHLLPRTKGFTLIASQIAGKIDYLYDITYGIQKVDGEMPNLTHLKNAQCLNASMYIRRIPVASIPIQDEKKCADFLQKLYQEKDAAFDIYEKTGSFDGLGVKKIVLRNNGKDLINALTWLVVIMVPSIYYFYHIFINSSLMTRISLGVIIVISNYAIEFMMNYANPKYASKFGLKKND